MSKAKEGDTVQVHYTGTLDDGTEFDSSKEREPIEFVIGSGQVIPGFESGVTGMELNETKQLKIKAQDAYGERKDEMVVNVPLSEFPQDINPEIGQQLQLVNDDGNTIVVTVQAVNEEDVVLDANHPLAGMDLNFDIELISIK